MYGCPALWSILLCCVEFTAAVQCVSTPFKFSINSRQNTTGHWVTQVNLEHGGKDIGPWDLEFQQTATKCKDSETLSITAKFSVPILNSSKITNLEGYVQYPGMGFYKFHTDLKTWPEARKACEGEGAHLAVINSEEEAKALGKFWDENPNIKDCIDNNWAYIGFHAPYKSGEYVTIFNETLESTGYIKWLPGEPNGYEHRCGIVFRRDNLLGDGYCDRQQPFFCKRIFL